MDVRSVDDHYSGGVPESSSKWESYILRQQEDVNTSAKSSIGKKRRRTVIGIPSLGAFLRQREDREKEKKTLENRRHSHFPTDHRDSFIFPFEDSSVEDVHEKYPSQTQSNSSGSFFFGKRTSPRTTRSSNHSSASRHSRYKADPTRKHTPDPALPDGSPTAFGERLKGDKATYHKNQPRRPHLRSNLSANQFANSAYQAPLPDTDNSSDREQVHKLTQTPYHSWREACNVQLRDKTTMTHVPHPTIPTCTACVTAAIIAGLTPPIACDHSLDKLIRTGVAEPPRSAAFRQAYFSILKAERQRWHTDRFGAVPSAYKPDILRAAQQLFIVANTLYENAKVHNE